MVENQEEGARKPGEGAQSSEEAAEVLSTNADGSIDVDAEGNVVSADGEERTARHDEDEHEDAPTHDAQGRVYSEEERARMRAERRDEKRRRRVAQRDREDRLRTTVDAQNRTISELTQRIAAMEQRGSVGELQQLERQLQEARDAAAWFKTQMGEAIKAQDGGAAADFSSRMTQATQRAEQLNNIRTAYLQQQNQPQRPALDPRHQQFANEWMADNRWYNPANPADPDSRVALAIDEGLSRETGRDPTTREYWDELTRRMKKYLPHRYEGAENLETRDGGGEPSRETNGGRPPAPRREVPRAAGAGGSGGDSSGRAGTFRLSKERVEAMQQAGYWQDPAKRAKMIKRYQEQDRAAAQQR